MKKIILTLLCSISISCFAYDYSVTGEDENGNSIEGTVYSNSGDRNVTGELTDEDGNTHEFEGQWDGYGKISGETDEGVSVDLETE